MPLPQRVNAHPIMHKLRTLPPNHPIFRKFPGLQHILRRPLPTGAGIAPPFDGGGDPSGPPTHEPPMPPTPAPQPDPTSGGGQQPWWASLAFHGYDSTTPTHFDLPPDPNAPMQAQQMDGGGVRGIMEQMQQGLGVQEADGGGLRDRLLNQFHQATPQLTSRAALIRHLQQPGRLRARQTRRPILPVRPPMPLRAAHRGGGRPY
jgi:hypothetical protein